MKRKSRESGEILGVVEGFGLDSRLLRTYDRAVNLLVVREIGKEEKSGIWRDFGCCGGIWVRFPTFGEAATF